MAMFKRREGTVVELIRAAVTAEVHFGTVGPARGRPSVLWIEGPGALSGAGERAVLGHERALHRAGFRQVECLGVDPADDRGRQGRLRAVVPDPGTPWRWERVSGAELQDRIIHGDELRPVPRPAAEPDVGAAVIALPVRRRRR